MHEAGRRAAVPPMAEAGPAARRSGPPIEVALALDGGVVPRQTAGLELLGVYQGSGFREPRYLARRGDGQMIQLSGLLYHVLAAADGTRDAGGIATRVTASYGREVTAGNIAYLLANRLQPLGVVSATAEEAVPRDAPGMSLLLGVKANRTLFPAPVVRAVARGLAWLHHPVVVGAVLVAFTAFDGWLFGVHGAIGPVVGVLHRPVLILAALGLSLAMMVFHEFGHASACHYSGARPGRIGFGLYLIWPATYTDVTDVYRASRAGRLRTDLGGVYFNLLFVLGLAAVYGLTGWPLLLAVALVSQFQVIQQLLPVVRLDGYFILGDLAGIPDLFGKVRPILASMVPGRPADPRVATLRRGARAAVTGWVLAVIPLLAAGAGYTLWNLPRMLATTAHTFITGWDSALAAFSRADFPAGLLGLAIMLLLAIPSLGMVYLLAGLGARAVRAARSGTGRRPR